jgi:uncharacterized protein YdhG (YjbR/CyaY superfamily)
MARRPSPSTTVSRRTSRARRAPEPSVTKSATRVAVRTSAPSRAPAPSSHDESVKAYFAALPSGTQQRLRRIRQLIRSVAPDATEWFSYGVPGFRLKERPFIWYAAFTSHVSLYPMTTRIRERFGADVERLGLETSKGTIRFQLDRPLPETLVKRLVKARKEEL